LALVAVFFLGVLGLAALVFFRDFAAFLGLAAFLAAVLDFFGVALLVVYM